MGIEVRDDTLYTSALPAGSWLIGGQSSSDAAPTAFAREAIYNYISSALAAVASSGSASDLSSGTVPNARLHAYLADISNIQAPNANDVLYFNASGDVVAGPITNATVGGLVATNNLSDLTDAATARTNLGLEIGTDVQASDADLTELAAGYSQDDSSAVTRAWLAKIREADVAPEDFGTITLDDTSAAEENRYVTQLAIDYTASAGKRLITPYSGTLYLAGDLKTRSNLHWTSSHSCVLAPTQWSALARGRVVTLTIASPCVATLANHGFVAGQRIYFRTLGTLPTGVSSGTAYYVLPTGLTADSFQFSTTIGGSAVNTSGTQTYTHYVSKLLPGGGGFLGNVSAEAAASRIQENITLDHLRIDGQYLPTVERGYAQAGGVSGSPTSTIRLRSAASAVDDAYLGQYITVWLGTGAATSTEYLIVGYNGTTKDVTVVGTVTTDATSYYTLGSNDNAIGFAQGATGVRILYPHVSNFPLHWAGGGGGGKGVQMEYGCYRSTVIGGRFEDVGIGLSAQGLDGSNANGATKAVTGVSFLNNIVERAEVGLLIAGYNTSQDPDGDTDDMTLIVNGLHTIDCGAVVSRPTSKYTKSGPIVLLEGQNASVTNWVDATTSSYSPYTGSYSTDTGSVGYGLSGARGAAVAGWGRNIKIQGVVHDDVTYLWLLDNISGVGDDAGGATAGIPQNIYAIDLDVTYHGAAMTAVLQQQDLDSAGTVTTAEVNGEIRLRVHGTSAASNCPASICGTNMAHDALYCDILYMGYNTTDAAVGAVHVQGTAGDIFTLDSSGAGINDMAGLKRGYYKTQTDGSTNLIGFQKPLKVTATDTNGAAEVLQLISDSISPAANDVASFGWYARDDGATLVQTAKVSVTETSVTAGAVTGTMKWGVRTAGTLADELLLTGADLSPVTSDGLSLGTTSLMWSDVFLASGAVINFNAGDVTITHAANQLNFQYASTGYYFDSTVGPLNNDGAALGGTANQWSDLFLADGAVLNFNNGNVTLTHSTGALTASGSFIASELRASGDVGGAASQTALTNVSDVTANSTGTGTIKFKGATNRDSSGFLKVYLGTTAYYVPVFSAISG